MITRFRWTESKIEILRTRYPSERAADIAATFNVKVNVIYCKAHFLGLKKSQEFYAGPNSGQSNLAKGAGTRFKKGQ